MQLVLTISPPPPPPPQDLGTFTPARGGGGGGGGSVHHVQDIVYRSSKYKCIYPSKKEGGISVHHVQDIIHELLRSLEEVSEVETRVALKHLLQLGVREHTQNLVVGIHQL